MTSFLVFVVEDFNVILIGSMNNSIGTKTVVGTDCLLPFLPF